MRPPKLDPPTRRTRTASEDELALWRTVTQDAVPLPMGKKYRAKATPLPSPRPLFRPTIAGPVVHSATEVVYPPAPGIDPLSDRTPGLDSKTAKALRRGTRAPEATVDLHGMTLNRAHSALTRFILAQRAAGTRCVLVITGKGGDYRSRADGRFDIGRGALRQDVPRWLREPQLAGSVVGIYQAHPRHGGDGALYVYLRKAR